MRIGNSLLLLLSLRTDNAAARWHLRAILRYLASVLLLPICLTAQEAAQPDKSPHFFLTAFGRGDSPAILQENELSVLVDKTPAQVKSVRSTKSDPLLFAVLVDVSKSDAETADSVKQAAFQFFETLSGSQREGYLVLFNHRVAVSRAPLSVSQAKQALDSMRFEGGTAVYDAIEQTCKQALNKSKDHERLRRVILIISDGEDNSSHLNHIQAEEAALEEGVSVFSVVTSPALGESRGAKFLKEISQKTGGFSSDKDVKKAVPLLLAAIDAQSEITVAPTQAGDGKLHPMKVKCSQKDVHIYPPDSIFFPNGAMP